MQAGILMGNLASAIGSGSAHAEDAALVAALKAGSEDAFAVLIAQYGQPLYSLILRSLQDPADAADITQEVFLKVFRKIGSFHGASSLRTWLYRIALHEASNQRRWWTRHKKADVTIDAPVAMTDDEESAPSLAETLSSGADSPFDQAVNGELRVRVEAALRELAEPFRVVVVLREMEGFSYDEIAEVLDLPVGTVKSRLMRGRSALKEILSARGLVRGGKAAATAGGAR